jgi:hypothetical protein
MRRRIGTDGKDIHGNMLEVGSGDDDVPVAIRIVLQTKEYE